MEASRERGLAALHGAGSDAGSDLAGDAGAKAG
jgi:hypothetical protein